MFTPGSVILIILLVLGLFKYRKYDEYYIFLVKVLIVFSIYIQIGFFINIGGNRIEYAEVLTVLVVLLGIPYIKNAKIPVHSYFFAGTFLLSIVIGYMLLIFSYYPSKVLPIGGSWDGLIFGKISLQDAAFSFSHIKRFIRVIFYLLLFCILDQLLLKNKGKSEELKRFILNSGLFFVLLCIIEQFSKLFFGTIFIDFSTFIFGISESQLIETIERGGEPAIQGLTHEPSWLVFSFMPAIFILMINNDITEKKRFFYFIAFIYVILISGSFAGVALAVLYLISYLISKKSLVIPKLFLLSVILVSVAIFIATSSSLSSLFSYYNERILSFINNGGIGSEKSRLLSVETAFNLFKENPFFGIGLGSTDVHGFLPTLLASCGSIGTVSWFLVMLKGFETSRVRRVGLLLFMLPFLWLTGSLRTVYGLHMILLFLFVFREYKEVTGKSYGLRAST
ncbi:O-antigen ligase family protein [Peribacillus butanolivorans]|uniref:O-antigen ligase family protein n=1 Tax=Peribacillus butanolivorans TaxID=421767 RepID=UPI0035E28A58